MFTHIYSTIIGVSFVHNILLYCVNFRSSNRLRMRMWFLVHILPLRGSGFQDLIIFASFMILSDRSVFLLSILGSTIFSSVNLKKIRIYRKRRKKAKYRLTVLFNKMRTNRDEKIIEHIMESRKIGLSDKIMKSAKMIKSWNPNHP